jgi:carbamoyl-phosphate synthase large subunit
MVNCNPETVSTDYDTSDRLYFEPLTLEDVLEIVHVEKPWGVIVQFGGQTPLKLARDLEKNGVPIIGTTPDMIDMAEDRERFQQMLERVRLRQPPNRTARTEQEALAAAEAIGYPLVVRPSYVLGGRAMEIVHEPRDLERYMKEAVRVSNDSPVLLDRFLNDAIEVDVDAVSDGHDVIIGGIMEHIEQAGVHSGDSACSLPAYSLSRILEDELRRETVAMARELHVVGLMNVQFAVKDSVVYILEVNPRASRTVPYLSKATGVPLAKIAARVMIGRTLAQLGLTDDLEVSGYFVKTPVFPFVRFPGVDTILGPEMKSTGEVMGGAATFGTAFAKAQLAAGMKLPSGGTAFISVNNHDKPAVVQIARDLRDVGFHLVATRGTANYLRAHGIEAEIVYKVNEGRPHVGDEILNNRIQLVINTPLGRESFFDDRTVRRIAMMHGVPSITTLTGAAATVNAIKAFHTEGLTVRALQEYHAEAATRKA